VTHRRLTKDEMVLLLCERMLKCADDHRLTPEQRERAERHLRNLRVIQKAADSTINSGMTEG
jgi:hypothetical protein